MKNATDIPFHRGLHELGGGAWAYLQPNGTLGLSNAGLLAGRGSSMVVDTLFDLHLAGAMFEAMAPILEDNPLTMAVNTHANPDHTFGNQLLPESTQVWASAAASVEFDDYPPAVMAEHQKMRSDDAEPVRRLRLHEYRVAAARPDVQRPPRVARGRAHRAAHGGRSGAHQRRCHRLCG